MLCKDDRCVVRDNFQFAPIAANPKLIVWQYLEYIDISTIRLARSVNESVTAFAFPFELFDRSKHKSS
jgi:hypothetical protein